VSLFDLCVAVTLFAGGLAYHWDCRAWGYWWVGDVIYGDGMHWWNCAVHVSEGLFADNPGRGFRPGYFVLTGLALPVLGTQFTLYHKFFTVAFLAGCLAFYLALRGTLGRLGAACAVALAVFNPFTAEWVSTPTTDATGLLLHLLALACLLTALNRSLSWRWLCGFALLFALATLTRPLVTPFLGLAVVALVLLPPVSWKRRLWGAGCVAVAFCLPALLWMAAQRVLVGEWSISSNDASAFYAASDPAIQVWNNPMYDRIAALARDRYRVDAPTPAQINRMFWREAVANYKRHARYHLERLVPHLWAVADFGPRLATHGSDFWRLALLSALAGGLCLGLLRRGELLRAAVVLAAGCGLWLSPHTAGFLTCTGFVLALLLKPGQVNRPGVLLLAGYWLTGVLALYLTGGTVGPPLAPAVVISPLGYRVGSQVFFAGDLLAGFCLLQLAGLHLDAGRAFQPGTGGVLAWCGGLGRRFWEVPDVWAGRVVLGSLGAVAVGTALVLTLGGGMIARRCYVSQMTPPRAYPDLAPVADFLTRGQGRWEQTPPLLAPDFTSAAANVGRRPSGKPDSGDVVMTGAGSLFVWNLAGQERAQMLIYFQENVAPFTMGCRWMIVEFPRHFPYGHWARKQGAFILRRLQDRDSTSNLPCFLTVPAVRAFVPLTADRTGYDLERAVVFPLTKYASQLEKAGELDCPQGALTWLDDSGPQPYQRRFLLRPDPKGPADRSVLLRVDPSRARGHTRLSFAYTWELDPAVKRAAEGDRISDRPRVRVRARGLSAGDETELFARTEPVAACPLQTVDLDLTGRTGAVIDIQFENLPRGTVVSVYELNLQADDFGPVP
jgi:hypothetical protein